MGGVIIWQGAASTIGSFIIIANLVTSTFDDGILHNRNVVIFISLFVLFPLCLLRSMNALRHASGGAIAAFLYMAVLVFVMFFVDGITTNEIVWVNRDLRVAQSIPVIIYAYTCHSQCLPVYGELKERTGSYMYKVVWGGVTLSYVLYSTVGVFGYLTFGSDVEDTILVNYDDSNPAVIIGRFSIVAAIILGYPMSSWVMRDSFEQIYFFVREKRNPYHELEGENYTKRSHRTVPRMQNLIEITVILAFSVALAILIPDIRTISSIVGSTSAVTINFIIPGAMFIRLCTKCAAQNKGVILMHGKEYTHVKARKVGAGILIAFGFAVGILGTAMTIYYDFISK